MKDIRNGTNLFLLIVLILAFSAQGSPHFLLFTDRNSLSSSSGADWVTPLRKTFLPLTYTPRTGIIPPSDVSQSPLASITDIIDAQAQYFPGSDIHIRNQFELIPGSDYYIVEQVIFIFLFEETSWTDQEMIAECNITDPTESAHYVHNATTNGISIAEVSLSQNSTHGWIDTTFTIPDLTELSAMEIASDNDVTIFQYYPANNETSKLSASAFLYLTDSFRLSATAEFESGGFYNEASLDSTFRQGESAVALLSASSGIRNIDNVSITCTLHNKTTMEEIANDTLGIQYFLRDVLTQAPRSTTDINGVILLFVNTSFPETPEDDYSFIITADFWYTQFYTENFEPGNVSSNVDIIIENFTVQNEPDVVADSLFAITNVQRDPMDPPNANNTIVTVQIQAFDAYGTGAYPLANIRVNATLDIQEVWVDIHFGAGFTPNATGWARTNLTGEITFNITAELFPIPYESKTPLITVKADLHSNLPPSIPLGQPHRFVENDTGGKIVTETRVISIDPDFWIGNIDLSASSTTSIRPGESTILEYEVFNAGNTSMKFRDVPVNITLEESISGVSLFINETIYPRYDTFGFFGYYFTDSDGRIEVTVSTTYLTTPEFVKNIALNITADFENDSDVRWIGDVNAIDRGAADTLANFDKTWRSVVRSTDLSINPLFNNCTISFFTTNETGDASIRPGDDITVTFIVRNQQGSPLSDVYVNVSLLDPLSYPGVSLTIDPLHSGAQDPTRPNYYKTDGSGEITVVLSTSITTTPKNLPIELIATADFENDTILYDKWLVGSKGMRPDFRSNSSYSEDSGTITVAPQYFIGEIVVIDDPNVLVQQNETLVVDFELRLREYDTGTLVTPTAILMDDINVSILINGQKPEDWNMEVTPAWSQYSDDSSVTFNILTNATGLTPEDMYTIEANADFGAAKGFTYNFSHATVPTGHLSGIWVNGSINDVNSTTSHTFEVKNIDLIRVWIPGGGVTDPLHSDAGFNSTSGLFEVYRISTIITIEGTYKDNTQDPVQFEEIDIVMNHSNGNWIPLASPTTDDQGEFSIDFYLPANTPLQDNIRIFGMDPTPPTPQEGREWFENIRVVTSINLNDYTLSNFNGSSVFVGRNVSVSGTLTDNLGMPIDSSSPIFSGSFSELNERIRVVGWNGTQEIGMNVNASPNVNGTYSLYYIVPHNYTTDDTLYIRLNITSPGLVHYRINYTQELIYVYWDFQIGNFQIHFPFNNTTTDLTNDNDSVYVVTTIDNRDIIIMGTLQDSTGRGLNAKWINPIWDGSSDPQSVNEVPAGYFSLDYSFTGWENNSWIWQFHHILDNGTILSKKYIVTLQWEVYDKTEPSITITNPIANSTEGIALLRPNDTIMITVTVRDPDSNVVSVGLDLSSVIITINGSSDTMVSSDNTTFSYIWNTSDTLDGTYIITIQVSDLANNPNETGIMIVFDVTLPTGTIDVTENSEGYLIVDHETGNVAISGTIEDNSSITDWNFGIDTTSARLYILNTQTGTLMINSSISINETSYLYEWGIILEYDGLELLQRNDSFSGLQFEEWTLRITFSDLAGNMNQAERNVTLDNTLPTLNFKDELLDVIEEKLVLNITFDDQESGIYNETLTLELLYANGSKLSAYTIRFGDSEMNATDTEATITLDVSELENGDYFVRARVFDYTGNIKQVDSGIFTINRPSPSNPLVNMIQLILAPILAFGGGIGLAALYERLKGIRGG